VSVQISRILIGNDADPHACISIAEHQHLSICKPQRTQLSLSNISRNHTPSPLYLSFLTASILPTAKTPPLHHHQNVQPTSLQHHPPRHPPKHLPQPPRHIHPTTNRTLHPPLLRLFQSRPSATLEYAPARPTLRPGNVRPAHESCEEGEV